MRRIAERTHGLTTCGRGAQLQGAPRSQPLDFGSLRTTARDRWYNAAMRNLALLALFAAGASCKGGCDDKPYVPYHIGDDAGSVATASPGTARRDAAASLAGGSAKDAPPGATEWSQNGLDLRAPAGTTFVRALFLDFDGDGQDDALAVARRENVQDALIAFYPSASGTTPPATVVLPQTKLAGDASCSLGSRIDPAGAKSALVEFGLSCAGHGGAGALRKIVLVTYRGQKLEVRAAADLFEPPDVVAVTGSGDDRDGDGEPDVTLTFRVSRAGGKSRPLSIVWLDRPAGLSRDLAEPEASLLKLAAEAELQAKSPKDAAAAALLASDVVALARVLCGPKPRVRFDTPTLACGESRALERTALAKLRAYVTLKQPHFALPAHEEAILVLHDRKEADKLALGSVTAVPVTETHAITVVPEVVPGGAPAYGPLTFENEGTLVVKTRDALVRVDPSTWEENPAPGVRYLSTVASPDGAYSWLEAYDPCDGVALRLTLAPIATGDVVDVGLPVSASLGRCGGKGESKRATPLAWTKQSLDILVVGYPVRVDVAQGKAELGLPDPSAPLAPGSARSPNGKLYASPTSLGLFVGGSNKLLTHADLGIPADLTGCTVANDGVTAACVRAGRAVVYRTN